MLATCWSPEAIITETEDPFENCPLSSLVSVLLGARLGAIRAQKLLQVQLFVVYAYFDTLGE